uniref:SRC kinase signaling inhibitor 1 n=1 Tax=Hucho hucho TaxID=62062 RepID=A0A4W5M8B4_9TELE
VLEWPSRERRKGHKVSAGDAEFPREYHTLGHGGTRRFPDNNSRGQAPTSGDRQRHNDIASKSLEALTKFHKADIERQREAFMDLQKNPKYPASPSMSQGQGSPNCGRQQQVTSQYSQHHGQNQPPASTLISFHLARTPRVIRPNPNQPALADQASRVSFASAESLETMSEAEVPLGFNRMNRLRQSLPLARSSSQAKLHAPGILFLQLGEEMRRVHLTHELTSLETLRALIVHMFPQRLTMAMLRCPSTALLIKDEARNVFYELEDPRDVQDRCVIKIYCKEPVYGTYPGHHNPHLANGDLRRDMVYTPQQDSPPNRRLSNAPASSASAPSGSPSRIRLLYSGGRPSSYQLHHQPQLQHHTQAGFSPSAILERRDVKPDEEVHGTGSRSMVLLRGDAGGIYADPYSLGQEGGRLSLAGPHSSLPQRGDAYSSLYRRGGGGGGLGPGSVRSLTSYSAAALQGELMDSGVLYRPGGPLYNDAAYAASMLAMGFRVPPPSSPQKIPDMRDSYLGTMPGRGSPGRQTLRRDSVSSSVFGESPKARGQGSGLGSDQLCLMAGPGGEGGGFSSAPGFSSPLPGNETETRGRMEAMEKQIASLTGLLQTVLTRGPETLILLSDWPALTLSAPLALMPPPLIGSSQPLTVSRLQMQIHLHDLQQNTSELRKQLSQLRNIQLENQDSVQSLLRQTESELSLMMLDAMRTQEDPLQRQRLLVEEERLKYLNQEELLIQQLHDLEKSVEELQRNSSVNHGLVTEQEVEQKSMELRSLGETLTELKNQFPSLQSKMRVVLRVEVEAVKFLKEEPHRLDALLKRCNTMTDTLTTLRRYVTEGLWKGQNDISSQSAKRTEHTGKSLDLDILTSPPLSLNDLGGNASLANWMPVSGSDPDAAERDWEEKRASLTQFSAQDINRLLEETQAELMKAIPDLDFAARQINKPAVTEHQPNMVQVTAQKLEVGSRRGSAELTVTRYRTEKPSKSPPPPPPRRSFPSAHGLTTNSTGEVIVTTKKKLEPEDGEAPKTLVKLRRTPSDTLRPTSTPPVIAASAIKDEDDEERIIAELEVGIFFSPNVIYSVLHCSVITLSLRHFPTRHHPPHTTCQIFQRTTVKVSPPHSLPSTLQRPTPAARTLPCASGFLGRKVNLKPPKMPTFFAVAAALLSPVLFPLLQSLLFHCTCFLEGH